MTWRRILNVINPVDLVTIAYLITTWVFIFFSAGKIEDAWVHLVWRIGAIAGILLFIWFNYLRPNKVVHVIHHFYPLVMLVFLYSETDSLNNVFFYNLDQWVADIEITIFQTHLSLNFSKWLPWLWFSEIMYASYFSFYILIPALLIYLYVKRLEDFGYAVFMICFSFYLYYILFILFPVAGPQHYFMLPDNQPPQGYVFSYIQQFIQTLSEKSTAAFPSAHVGIVCIVWYLCAKFVPQWLKYYIPIGVLLIISTVYIKAHYAIDVVAGFLTVPTMYWISKYLYEFITHGLTQDMPLMRFYITTKGKIMALKSLLRKK